MAIFCKNNIIIEIKSLSKVIKFQEKISREDFKRQILESKHSSHNADPAIDLLINNRHIFYLNSRNLRRMRRSYNFLSILF